MKQILFIITLLMSVALKAGYPPSSLHDTTDNQESFSSGSSVYIIPQIAWGICGLMGFAQTIMGLRRIYHRHQVHIPDLLVQHTLWDNDYRPQLERRPINPYLQTCLGLCALYGSYILCNLE